MTTFIKEKVSGKVLSVDDCLSARLGGTNGRGLRPSFKAGLDFRVLEVGFERLLLE
jgi:hypothetical protein